MKKWYVYDEADCFACYNMELSEMAMRYAADLATEFEGVHIVCMTDEQAQVYNKTGDLCKALSAK